MSAAAGLVEVRVPDIGNFKDVAVIDVLVKAGDSIAIDTPLVTLESDKATMDVPSTAVGVVEKVHISKDGKVNTGDLIATGTPPGVGLGMKPPTFLNVGDIVTLGIEGLGEQRQEIVAA